MIGGIGRAHFQRRPDTSSYRAWKRGWLRGPGWGKARLQEIGSKEDAPPFGKELGGLLELAAPDSDVAHHGRGRGEGEGLGDRGV